ncbi:MAG: putative N-acyltransferase [Myxococcota bacterium]
MNESPPASRWVISAHPGIKAVAAAEWDAVVGPDGSPFQQHAFLAALETARCVGDDTGWSPVALTVRAGSEPGAPLIGAAAAYIKGHSMGEFVYDWAWADAAQRMGVPYYPKLIIAAPFSPVSGKRLHVAQSVAVGQQDLVRSALLEAALQVATDVGGHGVHMLFCDEADKRVAASLGFAHRLGIQYQWRNEGYRDFDDFLARFTSKRRNQIRRERRRVQEAGFTVQSYQGDTVHDDFLDPAFQFYCATVDQFAWGRRYLNRQFFELLWADMRPSLQLALAHRESRVVAGTLNLQDKTRRYGRYWGTERDADGLHFEVCSYHAIEDCITHGIQVFEAGAGGGSHKFGRGFLPAQTHSMHRLFEPRLHRPIARYCEEEAEQLMAQITEAEGKVFVR